MSTLKGCLFLLAVFGAAWWWERRVLQGMNLEPASILAGLLGLGLAIVVSGWVEFPNTLRKMEAQGLQPEQWEDGQAVRVSGRIRPKAEAKPTPFGKKQGVIYNYKMWRSVVSSSSDIAEDRLEGSVMRPCYLEAGGQRVALAGFPSLQSIPEDHYEGEEYNRRGAEHAVETTWKIPTALRPGALWESMQEMLGGGEALDLHVLGGAAPSRLLAPEGEAVAGTWEGGPAVQASGKAAAELVFQRMKPSRWYCLERVIPEGAEVTISGTYRANPPRIDIGQTLEISTNLHEILLGGAQKNEFGQKSTALGLMVGLSVLVGAAHLFVFLEKGKYFRGLLEWVLNLD